MIFEGPPETASIADVCIIGSGPVGLALAMRCASKGLRVTIIEAGYPSDTGRKADPSPIEFVNASHVGADIAMMRSVGGTSHLWGGRCVMFDDLDFHRRDHVPHSGWPIGHDALKAHYREALRFLGCNPPDEALPAQTTQQPITLDNVEWWTRNGNVADLHGDALHMQRNLRVHTGCVAQRALLDAGDQAIRGIEVEHEGQRVTVRAQHYVLAAGGLENTRLLMATRAHLPSLFGGEEGPLGRYYCGHLTGHLAGIVFSRPDFARKLWFQHSKGGGIHRQRMACAAALQNAHALLNSVFWLESYSISDAAHGSGLLSALYLALSGLSLYPRVSDGLAARAGAPTGLQCHLANLRHGVNPLAALGLGRQLARRRRDGQAFALFNSSGRYLLRYHAEHMPNRQSRAMLQPAETGKGPGLRVDLRFAEADFDSIIRSHEIIDDWLRATGIGHLHYLAPPEARSDHVRGQALDGFHQIGLTRMAEDSRFGIVDADCRVHGLRNLHIAGSSVFPTAGQANPTLPAVALALRLGDHLAHNPAGYT